MLGRNRPPPGRPIEQIRVRQLEQNLEPVDELRVVVHVDGVDTGKLLQYGEVKLWLAEPGVGEIRPVVLPEPGPDEVLVRTLRSAVSRGSETLVFRGQVPVSQYDAMRRRSVRNMSISRTADPAINRKISGYAGIRLMVGSPWPPESPWSTLTPR